MRNAVAILLWLLLASAAAGAESRIVYVTGSTYYVDAGRRAGLQVGDELELWRDGAVAGRLVVRHLASARAACELLEGAEPIVGDVLRFTARAGGAGDTGTQPATERSRRPSAVYGRITLQQQYYRDGSGYGDDLYRPALDARMEGRGIGGHPLDLLVDARAHRSLRAEGLDDTRTRVYRLEATWRFREDRLRVHAGRQRHASLPSLGSFDGLSLEFGSAAGFGYGVAAGTQPEPGDLEPSTDVVETAVHLRGSGGVGAGRWDATLAAIGSYEESEISREYFVLRGRYRDADWTLSAVQELDLYRGWKADVEDASLGDTSRYLFLRRRLLDRATLSVGYDSRRSVRIYRHRETPASEFDDSYRNGFWSAAELRGWAGVSFGLRVRTRNGSGAGSMDSETLHIRRIPIYATPILAALRTTRYDNEFIEGWLGTIALDAEAGALRGGLEFGLRSDDPKDASLDPDDAWWISGEADYRLNGSWSTTLSWDHFGGASDSHDTVYSGLRYRF